MRFCESCVFTSEVGPLGRPFQLDQPLFPCRKPRPACVSRAASRCASMCSRYAARWPAFDRSLSVPSTSLSMLTTVICGNPLKWRASLLVGIVPACPDRPCYNALRRIESTGDTGALRTQETIETSRLRLVHLVPRHFNTVCRDVRAGVPCRMVPAGGPPWELFHQPAQRRVASGVSRGNWREKRWNAPT